MILAPILRPLSVGLDDLRFPEREEFPERRLLPQPHPHFFSLDPYVEQYFLSLRLRNRPHHSYGVGQYGYPLTTPVANNPTLREVLAPPLLPRIIDEPPRDWKTSYDVPEIPGLAPHEVIQYLDCLSLFSCCLTFNEQVEILEDAADTFWDILSGQDSLDIDEDTWCFIPDVTSSLEPSSINFESPPPSSLYSSSSSSSSSSSVYSSCASQVSSVGSSIWDNTPATEPVATAPASARHRSPSPGLPPAGYATDPVAGAGDTRTSSRSPSPTHKILFTPVLQSSLSSTAPAWRSVPPLPPPVAPTAEDQAPYRPAPDAPAPAQDAPYVPTAQEVLMATALQEEAASDSPRSARSTQSEKSTSSRPTSRFRFASTRRPTLPPVPRAGVGNQNWVNATPEVKVETSGTTAAATTTTEAIPPSRDTHAAQPESNVRPVDTGVSDDWEFV